ncbi:MAG: hypothetical protein ACLUD2_12400 [Clostridium sp.]
MDMIHVLTGDHGIAVRRSVPVLLKHGTLLLLPYFLRAVIGYPVAW